MTHKSAHSLAKIIFYRIKESRVKIQLVCAKAEEAIEIEKRLLFVMPNIQAAQFIDSLLWQTPPESFIPHSIAETQTPDFIAITTQENSNVNQAAHIFHLCPTPSKHLDKVEQIYEIYDETDPSKRAQSEERLNHYRLKGCDVRINFFP